MSEEKHHICIVGPGSVGLFLAAQFSASHHVSLLVRNYQLEALKEKDLHISGSLDLTAPWNQFSLITTEDLPSLPSDTSYWLCVKAFDVDEVVGELASILSKKTPLVLISNGLGVFFQVATLLGRKAPVVRVCPYLGVKKLSDTEVELAGDIYCSLATMPSDREAGERILPLVEEISTEVVVEKDIATAEWKKAVTNLVVNPICTVLNVENGAILQSDHLRGLASRMLHEVRSVAASDGFDLSSLDDTRFFESLKHHASNMNSTLIDLRAGNKTETEFILGRFLRIASDNGVEAPLSSTLHSLLKFLEEDTVTPFAQ